MSARPAEPVAPAGPPGLCIVIPALDAAAVLPATLAALQAEAFPGTEILVVDGGSSDDTAALARAGGSRVIAAAAGRGPQLSAGAAATGAGWLLFLHADSRPDPGWSKAVLAFTAAPGAAGRAGFFRLRFASPAAAARRVERLANWRAEWLGLPYGDQGLLIARGLYATVGGYPPWPLMEDVALVRRLGRRRLAPLSAGLVTSAAKYERDGWLRRPAGNLLRLGLYFLGVPPQRLARRYR